MDFLSDDSRLMQYAAPLVSLLSYVLRSTETDDLIQLPLRQEQLFLTEQLRKAVMTSTKNIPLLHQLCYTFSEPLCGTRIEGQWKDPLHCFLAISNLCIDGNLRPISLVTKQLAEWKYLIRNGVAAQGLLYSDSEDDIEM